MALAASCTSTSHPTPNSVPGAAGFGMQRCCSLQGSSIHQLSLRPQEILAPIRWSCKSSTGSILVLETGGQREVGHRGWHVGDQGPCGGSRDRSSPEDGYHHQNPPGMVEVAPSAPVFSVALCRSRSPLANHHHSLDLTPHGLPISQGRPSKQLLKLKGCFPFYCRDLGLLAL